MAARLKVLRSNSIADSYTGDLFRDISTGQATIVRSTVGSVFSETDEEIGLKRAQPADDESQLVDVEQLYPATAELNTRLSAALGLLGLALGRIERALEALRAKDVVTADDHTNHLFAVLQELFCLRDVSEGFASVVGACISGIQNSEGVPFSEAQLIALNSSLRSLKKKPFLSFETSLDVTGRLEEAGLNIDAQGTEPIHDWLSSGVR